MGMSLSCLLGEGWRVFVQTLGDPWSKGTLGVVSRTVSLSEGGINRGLGRYVKEQNRIVGRVCAEKVMGSSRLRGSEGN